MQAQLLTIVHHRNLVSLIGYCNEGEIKALIYEYMANGNLQQQLLGNYILSALLEFHMLSLFKMTAFSEFLY